MTSLLFLICELHEDKKKGGKVIALGHSPIEGVKVSVYDSITI